MSHFIYSRKNWVKIYRTSDLDSMMNWQPEDRQWTPTLEDGLFHYIQGHDFDQINSFFCLIFLDFP